MNRLSYATVLADRTETRYLRTGSGPTVVLLRPAHVGGQTGPDPLVSALAGQFKVIVPEFPTTPAELHAQDGGGVAWLRGFLDGLGIKEALVLVSGQMSWLAARLRHEDPDRIQAIAILLDDEKAESVRAAVSNFFGVTTT